MGVACLVCGSDIVGGDTVVVEREEVGAGSILIISDVEMTMGSVMAKDCAQHVLWVGGYFFGVVPAVLEGKEAIDLGGVKRGEGSCGKC